jgi:hypothetical protein
MPRLPAVVSAAAAVTIIFCCSTPCSGQKTIALGDFFPSRFQRGVSGQVRVCALRLKAVRSVTVSPPEGVTVGTAVATRPISHWVPCWSIPLAIDGAAQPGVRTFTIASVDGSLLYAPQTIVIADHAPAISDLEFITARKKPETSFLFHVVMTDEHRDLGDRPRVFGSFRCGRYERAFTIDGVIKQSEGTKLVVAFGAILDRTPSEPCQLSVAAEDTAGNVSNSLQSRFEFETGTQ